VTKHNQTDDRTNVILIIPIWMGIIEACQAIVITLKQYQNVVHFYDD